MSTDSASPLFHGNLRADWERAHQLLKGNDSTWQNLAFDGVQAGADGQLIEHRRCPGCGSSISRPVSPADALRTCQQISELSARCLDAISDSICSKPRSLSRRGHHAD